MSRLISNLYVHGPSSSTYPKFCTQVGKTELNISRVADCVKGLEVLGSSDDDWTKLVD